MVRKKTFEVLPAFYGAFYIVEIQSKPTPFKRINSFDLKLRKPTGPIVDILK